MVERLVLVDKKKIEYEGIFNLHDLYRIIDEMIQKKGYTKMEIKNTEIVKKGGRFVDITIEPWKKMSDYAKSAIKIKMKFDDIKDIKIKKEGIEMNMNQGKVTFWFDAYLENDFENKWENAPGFFFVRVLFDKYIFKPFTTNYQAKVMQDFNSFYNEIKACLNLNKY